MSPRSGMENCQDFAFDAARTLIICFIVVLSIVWSRRTEQDAEHDADIWSRRCKRCFDTADEHEQSHEMMIDDDDDENFEASTSRSSASIIISSCRPGWTNMCAGHGG